MTTETVVKLPDLPSELLALALDDLEKCQADEHYSFYMGTWHKPSDYDAIRPSDEGVVCNVCVAGAVIGKTLGAHPEHSYTPSFYNFDTSYKLLALDNLRMGSVTLALRSISHATGLSYDEDRVRELDAEHIPPQPLGDDLPKVFVLKMRKIVTGLQELGL